MYFGRGGRIRTADPLLPKQMRYQTALRPDRTEHGVFYRLLADTARILRFRKTEQCGNIREFRDEKSRNVAERIAVLFRHCWVAAGGAAVDAFPTRATLNACRKSLLGVVVPETGTYCHRGALCF